MTEKFDEPAPPARAAGDEPVGRPPEGLLEEEKVAAVPGIAFGADDYVRISYATSMANIEKGLDRMAAFCKRLAG